MLTHVKSIALVAAAAIAFTSIGIAPSRAAVTHEATVEKVAPITDFSSRRRAYGYHRNNAAALGTFLAIAGTVAAIAAANNYRRHYYYGGYPYGGPYYGGPYYGGPYYGGRYYGGPYGYYGPRYGW